MTEIAASDFRHPRRHVRLDTILRLRWLAALGQLAAIFIVAQGLEFDVPVIPCVAIVGLSALAQSRAADRLQPDAAAGTGLCRGAARAQHRRTRGTVVPHRRPAKPVLVPVPRPGPDLGDRAADPADHCTWRARGRLRLGAGILPSAAAMGQRRPAGAAADLSVRRLALDRGRDRRHLALCVPGHRRSAETLRRAGRDRTGADPRAASHPDRRPCRRRRARTRHAAVDDLPDFARARKDG